MRRFAIVAAVAVLASCSSGHKQSTPASTTTTSSTTTSSSTMSTLPTTTAPTASSSSSTPTTVAATSSVRIVRFSGPSQPQQCNAPTMVQLSWTTVGAARVTLSIDNGPVFATYANGSQAPLVYLACDGHAHTYTLVATNGTARASRSVTVRTQPPA